MPKKPIRKMPVWSSLYSSNSWEDPGPSRVDAWTKSEARSTIKLILGLHKSNRLPAGFVVYRVL